VATQLLPDDLLAMMARGVSVIVGSCDARKHPSVMRAVGSHVDTASGEITVFLARPHARQLLQDIAAGNPVSTVFSQPSTHRTVQVKARCATQRNAEPGDREVLARYLTAMEGELLHVHIPPELTRAMLAHRFEDVVAVTFRPEQAFDQTPGPQAGRKLPGPA
jgi:hypothetical protein